MHDQRGWGSAAGLPWYPLVIELPNIAPLHLMLCSVAIFTSPMELYAKHNPRLPGIIYTWSWRDSVNEDSCHSNVRLHC